MIVLYSELETRYPVASCIYSGVLFSYSLRSIFRRNATLMVSASDQWDDTCQDLLRATQILLFFPLPNSWKLMNWWLHLPKEVMHVAGFLQRYPAPVTVLCCQQQYTESGLCHCRNSRGPEVLPESLKWLGMKVKSFFNNHQVGKWQNCLCLFFFPHTSVSHRNDCVSHFLTNTE